MAALLLLLTSCQSASIEAVPAPHSAAESFPTSTAIPESSSSAEGVTPTTSVSSTASASSAAARTSSAAEATPTSSASSSSAATSSAAKATATSSAAKATAAGGSGTRTAVATAATVTKKTFYSDQWQQEVLKYASSESELSLLHKIADYPWAKWLTGSEWDAENTSRGARVSAEQGTRAVFVLYAIPNRDCGSYSAGGMADGAAYLAWVRQMVSLMGGHAWVILEPDALASDPGTCGGASRESLLHDAGVIARSAGNRVYLDIGHSNWLSPAEAAARIKRVGADAFDGISLNVSNYETTANNVAYAEKISAAYGSTLHYVIDTSRNGNGPTSDHQWCNPRGRALGDRPHLVGGAFDAALWIKIPGASDGNCNGGPASGEYWKEYALELATNAHW